MEIVTSRAAYAFARDVIEDMLSSPLSGEGNVSHVPKTKTEPHSGGISYSKWDSLLETINAEEREQEKREENQKYWNFAGRCAHDKSQERQIFEKPTHEKRLAAQRFHKEGNEAYANKNYALASLHYKKALLQIDYSFPETGEEVTWMESEKLAAHLNMALCKLKQCEWQEALLQCRLALRVDPNNLKAHYRRGLAYLAMDDYIHAEEALCAALSICTTDKDVQSALIAVKQKRRAYQKKQKRLFKKIIRGDQVEPEPLTSKSELSPETLAIVDHDDTESEDPKPLVNEGGSAATCPVSCFHSVFSEKANDERVNLDIQASSGTTDENYPSSAHLKPSQLNQSSPNSLVYDSPPEKELLLGHTTEGVETAVHSTRSSSGQSKKKTCNTVVQLTISPTILNSVDTTCSTDEETSTSSQCDPSNSLQHQRESQHRSCFSKD